MTKHFAQCKICNAWIKVSWRERHMTSAHKDVLLKQQARKERPETSNKTATMTGGSRTRRTPQSKSAAGAKGHSQGASSNEQLPQGPQKQTLPKVVTIGVRELTDRQKNADIKRIRKTYPKWKIVPWNGQSNPHALYSREYMAWEEERGWPGHPEHPRSAFEHVQVFEQPDFDAEALILTGDIDVLSEAGLLQSMFPEGINKRLLDLWFTNDDF
jgi:hypothetical protein